MELLRQTIEQWVAQAVSDPGAALWTTDSLLVLCSVTLAAAAYHACRRLVLPAILHFVKHTSVSWDDILLNAQTLRHICLVVPAGIIYRRKKSRKTALWGALLSTVIMAAISIPINYFISYPVYSKLIPIEAIIGMYQQIRPNVNGLLECLVLFNAPFTLVKGLLCTALCFLIYKPLSPLLHR